MSYPLLVVSRDTSVTTLLPVIAVFARERDHLDARSSTE